MAAIGLNVARDGSHAPSLIRSLGATWLRVVAMAEHDLTGYFQECRAAGLRILLVLARESFSQQGALTLYRDRYGALVDAIQVGNEPDLESESSWTMTPGELAALGRDVRRVFPTMTLVHGGLASGHATWLDGADLSWCDAIGVHAYLKDAPSPGDLEDLPDVPVLLADYQRFGKRLLVTEWGWWDDAEPRASEETRDMVTWAGSVSTIDVLFYFCIADSMVPPFGLLRTDGREKPRARAFREAAAKALPATWPSLPAPHPEPTRPLHNPWEWFSVQQIAQITGCPEDAIRENWPKLVEQLGHCQTNNRVTQIAMIGTVAIESARRFQPIHEFRNADGSIPAIWHTYDGGPDFHGRGFIQLTHRYNYAAYGPKVAELWGAGGWEPDFDLVGNPDRALNPDISAAVSALYFRDHGGDHAYLIPLAAGRRDWREVRRLVQGGDAGLAELTAMCEALFALPIPSPTPIPTPTPEPSRAAVLIGEIETRLAELRSLVV